MKITLDIDTKKLREQIEATKTIDGKEAFFKQLTVVQAAKQELAKFEDELSSIELEAKGLINAKAKALFGDNWQVIKGESFKITRSKTGDVYTLTDGANSKFIKVKKSVDTKAVDAYVAEHAKLPKGIELNEQRGESIRITL